MLLRQQLYRRTDLLKGWVGVNEKFYFFFATPIKSN